MKASHVVRRAGAALICAAAVAAVPSSAAAATKTLGYAAMKYENTVRAESSIATAKRTTWSDRWTVSGRATIRDRANDGRCARVQLVFYDARGSRLASWERTDCAGVWRTHSYNLSFDRRPTRIVRYVGTKQMWSGAGVISLD
jgi:hypothetical protein